MSEQNSIPKHVAIVMDGNGRWAKKRFLPRTAGHREGVKTARKVIQTAGELGVKVLTLFAFSSENWQRPQNEVSTLMGLFFSALEQEVQSLAENGVCLQFIGDRSRFSDELQNKIIESEKLTASNDEFVLNIAANYGGRWDVVQAAKNVCARVIDKEIMLEEISESDFSRALSTHPQPDPDLFIRTAGEKRISNFLMWQLAYTELYFTDVLWPDFDDEQLQLAIEEYGTRKRKYGLTQEQVDQNQEGNHA